MRRMYAHMPENVSECTHLGVQSAELFEIGDVHSTTRGSRYLARDLCISLALYLVDELSREAFH